jgi:formylglycine-generating enzyme required for sulfatase activity
VSAGEALRGRRSLGERGLPESEAVEVALAAARGLAAAHGRGIVHRDIKPENILIPHGVLSKAKLADLGLAKPEGDQTRLGTSAGAVLGTPGFMAPEQIEDPRAAGPAADVFSMGATLYALLAGEAPFSGTNLGAILRTTASEAPPELPGDVSEAVRALVRRCLSKDPAGRPADGAELLRALEAIREGRAPAGPSRRGRPVVAALAGAVLVGAVTVYALLARDDAVDRPAVPPAGAPLVLDLGQGVSMEFVSIEPGSFMMGGPEAPAGEWQADERPEHEVTITRGFHLGRTEVTRRQFAAFVGATGFRTDAERDGRASGWVEDRWAPVAGLSWRQPMFEQADDHPVVCITWNDAQAFCTWLSLKSSRTVRLPTEAEWEYACRAGTKTRWSFGDDASLLEAHAWARANSGMQTRPVGRKRPNAWGLFDMHGNMWEWCEDWAGPYPERAVDPAGPSSGERKILRGGGWDSPAEACRSSYRCQDAQDIRQTLHGFRVVVQ